MPLIYLLSPSVPFFFSFYFAVSFYELMFAYVSNNSIVFRDCQLFLLLFTCVKAVFIWGTGGIRKEPEL